MGRRFAPFSICSFVLLISALAACVSPSATPALADEASALDLAGNSVDPLQSASRKIVVLVFVRTDCPISNRYAPTIQRLSNEHADNAAFWLVYPSKAESPEMIRKHRQEFHYRIPALRDLHQTLVRKSQVQMTPEVAVFDVNRRLVYHGRIDNLYEDFGHARKAPTTHELEDAISAAVRGEKLQVHSAPSIGCYISDLE
jgi:Thioredoxin-like